jgi:multidrug transporter EmrE-like cation transporter
MSQSFQSEGNIQPRIVRGQVDSLSLFEITDYELQLLEQGSPNNIYLNFAIFFLSIAISFFITLLTVKIDSLRVYLAFFVFTVVGFSIGGVLAFLWYRSRTHVRALVHKIKARVPLTTTDSALTVETEELSVDSSSTEQNAPAK